MRIFYNILRATVVVTGPALGFVTFYPILAQASPVTLTGNYLEVGISDYGTFGSDGSTEPGILVDPTGTGNFYPGGIPNDLLTPGIPHDGFTINSAQTGLLYNDNIGDSGFGFASPTLLTGAAALGFNNAASWTSTTGGVAITNSYYFNTNSQIIDITSSITNNTGLDLTSLYFGRSEDPDPDVYRYGSYESINTLGDSQTAASLLVSGAGPQTGFTIGILNTSKVYSSNTDVSYNCCDNDDPGLVYNGVDPNALSGDIYPNTVTGDYGLQMAWSVGTLSDGATATINYEYVFGANQGTVSSAAPEASTWAMLLLGFAGLGFAAHRRASKVHSVVLSA